MRHNCMSVHVLLGSFQNTTHTTLIHLYKEHLQDLNCSSTHFSVKQQERAALVSQQFKRKLYNRTSFLNPAQPLTLVNKKHIN